MRSIGYSTAGVSFLAICVFCTGGAGSAEAKVVALDIDIVLDRVSPEEKAMTVGMHHNCRVFYDDSTIDAATHRVRVLHEQHTPMLIPKHLDPLQEPMTNAWLDLSAKPYRYHYAASPGGGNWPFPYTILFDEKAMRMTIRKQSDGSLLLSGPYTIDPSPITGPEIDAAVATSDPVMMPWQKGPPMTMRQGPAGHGLERTISLDMDVELDQVAPEDAKMYRVGGHDLDRIAYDGAAVDPVTHKVKITSLAHFIMGRWMPTTPTESSTLDLSGVPYKLDFVAAVDHGRPLVVVFEGATQRMAILAQPDFHVLIAGKYVIDPKPLTGAAAAAAPAKANDPSTMPIKSGMPPMSGTPPTPGK